MNILLADDDKTSRELIRRILESDGANTVVPAADGEEAWQHLQDPKSRFDVGVFDVMMPRLDGIELLKRIRETPGFHALPVILCTAAHDRPTVERAGILAVNHYIVKPFTRAIVLEKLNLVHGSLTQSTLDEDREIVAHRLGIKPGELAEMETTFLAEIRTWMASARGAQKPDGFRQLAVNVNGFKGTSLSLGLRGLEGELDAIETTFTREFSAPHRVESPPTPAELAATFAAVEVRLKAMESRAAPAAA